MSNQYNLKLTSMLIAFSCLVTGCNEEPAKSKTYAEYEVSYPGGNLETTIAGTLSLPNGKGPFPVILLISGSGDNDRDETIGPFKPFAVLADALNKQGYAVLRYDDRGTAHSSGNFSAATVDDFAADAVAGMRYLLKDPRINQHCLILTGHSEGSYIASLAAQSIRPDAVVFLAGASQAMSDVFLTQLQTLSYPDSDPVQIALLLEAINNIVASTSDMALAANDINKLLESEGIPQQERSQLVSVLATTWWQRYLNYQPGIYLSALDMPVLALYGDKDTQVRALDNAHLMQTLLRDPASRVEVLSGMNHLFQQAVTGLPSEYFTLTTVFEAAMSDAMISWLGQALPAQCGDRK